MKKSNIILAVAAGTLLASCASSLTRAEASKKLADMGTHVAAESFTLPTKATLTSAYDSGESGKGSTLAAYDLDKTYLRTEIKGATPEATSYSWSFEKDGKFYTAVSNDADASSGYYFETTAETIKGEINEHGGKDYLASALTSLANTLNELGSEVSSSSTSEAGQAINVKTNELKESYTSSGDGNLKLSFNYDFEAEVTINLLGGEKKYTLLTKDTFEVAIDNYLIRSAKTEMKYQGPLGEGVDGFYMMADATYDWGKCDIKIPDLSKLTPANEN